MARVVRKLLHALLNTLQSKVALNCDSLQCIVPANADRFRYIATIIKWVRTANKEVRCYSQNKTSKHLELQRISPDTPFPKEHQKDHNLWSIKQGISTNSNMFNILWHSLCLTVLEGILDGRKFEAPLIQW